MQIDEISFHFNCGMCTGLYFENAAGSTTSLNHPRRESIGNIAQPGYAEVQINRIDKLFTCNNIHIAVIFIITSDSYPEYLAIGLLTRRRSWKSRQL